MVARYRRFVNRKTGRPFVRVNEFIKANKEKSKVTTVKCNAISKTPNSFNINLTPSQAIKVATNILNMASVIMDEGIEDGAVQLFSIGPDAERLMCGLIQARSGPRRKKKRLH